MLGEKTQANQAKRQAGRLSEGTCGCTGSLAAARLESLFQNVWIDYTYSLAHNQLTIYSYILNV